MTLGIGATASAGYTFTAWTGDCAGPTPSLWIALNGPRTCAAVFTPAGGTPAYQLTIAPAPAGGLVSGPGLACGAGGASCQVAFGSATTTLLTATPSSGFAFSSWGGACSGTTPTTTVLVDAARTCTAAFTATGGGPVNGPPYTLTISPPTGGKVQGAGINCGAGGTACSVTMPASMTLGIGATAGAGYTFSGWTGDCAGVNPSLWVALDGPRTCGALFTPAGGSATYQLTIAPAPAGGTVTGNGLTCGTSGSTCAMAFGSATTASLTAAPAPGYAFTAWGGACSGTDASTTVLVDAAITCTATFTATGGPVDGPPYTLTINSPAGGKVQGAGINCGAGGTACSVTMPAAMTLGVSATASSGYVFTEWTGDCTGTSPSQWVSLNGPRTCGATFTATGGGGTPASGIISTVAGTGAGGFGGDGGAATAALLLGPTDAAVDAAGNIYISDHSNNRIRKVAAGTGIITTMAGSGTLGFSGDGGPATDANISAPFSIAVDAAGNLYIADYYNYRIRRVDAGTGIITTVAGTGVQGYGGDGGPATAAVIDAPYEIALDAAGNIYIAELDNHRIRKVTAASGVIETFAGTGTAGFSGDGGLATAAALNNPIGVVVDAAGNVYISDNFNHRVRMVTAATGIITTVAGTGVNTFGGDGGPATTADLNSPRALAVDKDGNLYISDFSNGRIRRVEVATGVISTFAGTGTQGFSGDGGPATQAQIHNVYGLGSDTAGNVYLADTSNSRVRKVGAGPAAPVDGPPYTLTITPPAGGKVQGAGINCGAGGTACSVTMPASMTLGIGATPSSGFVFGGWTGNCSGTNPSLWVALNGPRTCGAVFTPINP